jgi:competence protein ComEC
VLALPKRRDVVLVALVLALFGGVRGDQAWAGAAPRQLGPFDGWARVVTDPMPGRHGTTTVLELDGERFGVTAFGSIGRRLAHREAGEWVEVVAVRSVDTGPFARRAQVRHVVGRAEVSFVGMAVGGAPVARLSNSVRGALRDSAGAAMPPDRAALFTGLVIGDDTRQPDEMIDRFRAVGMSHLTAVSGQNVAFVLTVAGVFLTRLSRWPRLVATLGVIAWFVILTRVEPSVLRAGTMAGLGALAAALGRERAPARIACLAAIVLVLVDPLLVWSVAFWLSLGATLGVSVVGPWFAARLAGPRWLIDTLSVTLGAQVGVLIPSWLVFERLPVLGIVANLFAVPVAGFVMLYGIPAGLAADLLGPTLGNLVLLPANLGTAWVDLVSRAAFAAEPHGRVAFAAWLVQLATIVALWAHRRRAGRMGDS